MCKCARYWLAGIGARHIFGFADFSLRHNPLSAWIFCISLLRKRSYPRTYLTNDPFKTRNEEINISRGKGDGYMHCNILILYYLELYSYTFWTQFPERNGLRYKYKDCWGLEIFSSKLSFCRNQICLFGNLYFKVAVEVEALALGWRAPCNFPAALCTGRSPTNLSSEYQITREMARNSRPGAPIPGFKTKFNSPSGCNVVIAASTDNKFEWINEFQLNWLVNLTVNFIHWNDMFSFTTIMIPTARCWN